MSPRKKFKWSSHTPVLQTAIELLQPELIVELGVGYFSSPIFLGSSAKKIMHIENDKSWLDLISNEYKDSISSEFIFHEIHGKVKKSTHYNSLSNDAKQELTAYYKLLNNTVSSSTHSSKFLFVDHFACARTVAINELADAFDMIAYHDAETPDEYNYTSLDTTLYNKFDHYVLKTQSTWTGFYIKKNLVEDLILETTVYKYSKEFGKEFGISNFELEKLNE